MTIIFLGFVAVAVLALCFVLVRDFWDRRRINRITFPHRLQIGDEEARARAESLLRASITTQEYTSLLRKGYLEVSSRLYPNRVYQIPRERRRVRVYDIVEDMPTKRHKKLGELCLITCEPVPDADLFLTHKWLLEADEATYLATANWIGGIFV